MAILEVKELTKHYKSVKAVNGLSFSIPAGCCFGLLGPNGAGKTTTIEMIEGITPPTSGEILYKGNPRDGNFKLDVGIQFQSTALMDFLTVAEVMELFSSLYTHRSSQELLIEKCNLKDILHQPAAKLSGGQRQRLLLAVALINDPQIVFLDEPTTGLDPHSRRNFWSLIEQIKQQGKTIVLTTHYMEEAEQLCDYLIIIDHGRIIAQGSPDTLLREHFDYVFVCIDKEDIPQISNLDCDYQDESTQIAIKTTSVELTLQQLINEKINLNSLRVRNPTLDDLFLKLTGHSLRD